DLPPLRVIRHAPLRMPPSAVELIVVVYVPAMPPEADAQPVPTAATGAAITTARTTLRSSCSLPACQRRVTSRSGDIPERSCRRGGGSLAAGLGGWRFAGSVDGVGRRRVSPGNC